LKHWGARFAANRDKAKAIYDERFCRMWEFYLAASEAAFRWQDLVIFQFQLAKKNDTLPVTRDYIAKCEKALELRDHGHPEPEAPAARPAKPTRRRKAVE
ncbi:SAM-dependent methyltransferase, partial [Mesorhizobium sp. M2A.F.Ca.ET.029.05.1.1]